MNATEQVTVLDKAIQIDRSGVGHCWVAADAIDCPADIQEEIAGAILEDGLAARHPYTASNGQKYRWV